MSRRMSKKAVNFLLCLPSATGNFEDEQVSNSLNTICQHLIQITYWSTDNIKDVHMYYIHGCVILIAFEQLFDIQSESESIKRQNLITQKYYLIESLLKRRKLNHVQNHNIKHPYWTDKPQNLQMHKKYWIQVTNYLVLTYYFLPCCRYIM